jgi:spoIIIJ-associated protein
MSSSLEFEGKDVEQAIKKACDALNITKDKLKHDVISYGSTGIFGLVGARKAKIRVKPPGHLHHRGKKPVSEKPLLKATVKDEPSKPVSIKETTTEDLKQDGIKTDAFSEDSVAIGRDALRRIVDCITDGATISVEQDEEKTLFRIEGGVSALLIGKHGQTLEAIQYLVEKTVNKHSEERMRIQVDVEGYLNDRQASLQKLVERLAKKAKQTGKPVTIGQMNAYDRRIVHLTLKDDNKVRTKSIGNGYIKKLMIFPRKNFAKRKKVSLTCAKTL